MANIFVGHNSAEGFIPNGGGVVDTEALGIEIDSRVTTALGNQPALVGDALVRTQATPQRAPFDPGVVLNDYSSLVGLTLTGNTLTEIPTTLATRERVVRSELPTGTTGATITWPVTLDMTNLFVSIPIKVLDANFQRMGIAISIGDAGFSKRYEYSPFLQNDKVIGEWHTVTIPLTTLNSGGNATGVFLTEARSVRAIKLDYYPVSTAAPVAIEIGPMRVHKQPMSGLVVVFDDGWQSTHDVAWPIMKNLGQIGNIAVTEQYVGDPGFMTLPQLQAMYADGWGMSNHTKLHGQLATIQPLSAMEASISDGYKYLVNNGMPEDAKHLVFPGGSWNPDVIAAMKKLNVRTGRRVGTIEYCTPDIGNLHVLPAWYITKTRTLASAKLMIDRVAERGGISYLTFHDINNAPTRTEDWAISDFTALMEYAATKKVNTYRASQVWG